MWFTVINAKGGTHHIHVLDSITFLLVIQYKKMQFIVLLTLSAAQNCLFCEKYENARKSEKPGNNSYLRRQKSPLLERRERDFLSTLPLRPVFASLQLSRNNSIGKACYTGYSYRKTYALELESNHHRNPGDALRSTGHSC